MKDLGIVQGMTAQAVPLIIGIDTVYVHTDIEPVVDAEGLYQYHETQYGKDEYIELMSQKNTDTQIAVAELAVTAAQKDAENKLAIAELAEAMMGGAV